MNWIWILSHIVGKILSSSSGSAKALRLTQSQISQTWGDQRTCGWSDPWVLARHGDRAESWVSQHHPDNSHHHSLTLPWLCVHSGWGWHSSKVRTWMNFGAFECAKTCLVTKVFNAFFLTFLFISLFPGEPEPSETRGRWLYQLRVNGLCERCETPGTCLLCRAGHTCLSCHRLPPNRNLDTIIMPQISYLRLFTSSL